MRILVKDIKLQYTEENKAEIVLSTDSHRVEISKEKDVIARGKKLLVEIKQYRRQRSLDANGYLWVLCQKIAEAIHSTKEEVYQEAVRKVGPFEIVPIRNDAVKRWIEVWNGRGLGWHAEIMEDSKIHGYKKIISYYGSSSYNTKEMSVLIDYIVDECKNLGIETMTPQEIAALKEAWGYDVSKTKTQNTETKKERNTQEGSGTRAYAFRV
jgi:hypothetical protein